MKDDDGAELSGTHCGEKRGEWIQSLVGGQILSSVCQQNINWQPNIMICFQILFGNKILSSACKYYLAAKYYQLLSKIIIKWPNIIICFQKISSSGQILWAAFKNIIIEQPNTILQSNIIWLTNAIWRPHVTIERPNIITALPNIINCLAAKYYLSFWKLFQNIAKLYHFMFDPSSSLSLK